MTSTQIVTITGVSTDAQNNVVASYADPVVSVILDPSVTSKYMPVNGDDLIIKTADDGTAIYTVAPPAAPAVIETAPRSSLSSALDSIVAGSAVAITLDSGAVVKYPPTGASVTVLDTDFFNTVTIV